MIELRGVTVLYPGRPPTRGIHGISLRLSPGVTVVQGPSGAGKSTLLRALATLQPPDEGAVRYPWAGGWATLPQLRSRVGYVPQENRLLQALSCEDALRYLAAVRGLPAGRRDVAPLLARWGLTALRARRLDRLSSGEARRWLLAQSQLLSPALWILDEPLHGLDAWAIQTLRAELARYAHPPLQGDQRYAVVATQDPSLDDLATGIVRLDRGQAVPA